MRSTNVLDNNVSDGTPNYKVFITVKMARSPFLPVQQSNVGQL